MKNQSNPDTISYARWYILMWLEAYERSLDEADALVEGMRQATAGNEIATAFWFRTMPADEANAWLEACRRDRVTAREQLAKVHESFQRMATGVSAEEVFKQ